MKIKGQTPLDTMELPLPEDIHDVLHSLWIDSVEELAALANLSVAKNTGEQEGKQITLLTDCACGALDFLSPAIRRRVATPVPMGAFGCLLNPEVLAAYNKQEAICKTQQSILDKTDLPLRTDLKTDMHSVRDQGERGTCVAFATVALREFLEPHKKQLSEQYLYCKCKEMDGVQGAGTFLRTALSVLHEYGVCHRETWPYISYTIEGNEGQGPPSPRADYEAKKYIMPYARLLHPHRVLQYKQILVGDNRIPGMPIVVGTLAFASWALSAEGYRTGKITMPLPGEAPVGGHAWCIIGYQDDKTVPGGGYFIVRNSWGIGWAPDSPEAPGHAMMPYAYVEKCAIEAFSGQSSEHIDMSTKSISSPKNDFPDPESLIQAEMDFIRDIEGNIQAHAAGLTEELEGKANASLMSRTSFDDKEILTDAFLTMGFDTTKVEDMPVNEETWLVLGTGRIKYRPMLCVAVKSFCGSRLLEIKTRKNGLVVSHIQDFIKQLEKKKALKSVAASDIPGVLVIFAPGIETHLLQQVCVLKGNNKCYFVNTSGISDNICSLNSVDANYGLYSWLALLPMTEGKRLQCFKRKLDIIPELASSGGAMTLFDLARHLNLPISVIIYLTKRLSKDDGYRVGPENGPAEFIQRL